MAPRSAAGKSAPSGRRSGLQEPAQGGARWEVEGATAEEIVSELPFGLLVTNQKGRVLARNAAAEQILILSGESAWPDRSTCCSLFGCNRLPPLDRHCLSELAAATEAPLPEVRVDVPPEAPTTAVWITALRLGEDRLLLHLRQGVMDDRRRRTQPHWMERPHLKIRALGRTEIETGEITIEGDWLLQRPGQILKYLVLHRDRPTHVDEIVEALWPKAGSSGRNTVRHFVHALRDRLEPERAPRQPSNFIHSSKGTYALARQVELDVRDFDALVSTGLERPAGTKLEREVAVGYLEEAIDLYRGDLFAEEPFADWAFAERERLRTLLHEALMRLVELQREDDERATAVKYLERCVDLWPLDTEIQRALIELYVEQGRHSDAQRRYEAFRHRLRVEFAQEADFRLVDLGAEAGQP